MPPAGPQLHKPRPPADILLWIWRKELAKRSKRYRPLITQLVQPQDIAAFLIFGLIAVACGLAVAVAFRRARHPFLWTAGVCGLGATLLGLGFAVAMQTVHSMNDAGYSFGKAVQSGFAAALVLAFSMPVVCGGPAALVGLGLQCILQRSWRRCRCKRERPPPLPDVIR